MIIVRRAAYNPPAAVIIPVNNNVIHRDGTMSEIALTVSVLALVAVVGLWIGNVKIRGVGFGIGGVLFGGIIVGHFVDQAGVTLSSPMLHFIQEFGLILFVYTIGIQVGPGFSPRCGSQACGSICSLSLSLSSAAR